MSRRVTYNLFCLWLSLPRVWQDKTDGELEIMGLDKAYIDLIKIKTMKEFSQIHKVSQKTLSNWSNDERTKIEMKRHWDNWTKKLTPNVVSQLYNKIMDEGDAPRIKLWKEWIEEEPEKVRMEHNFQKILDNIKEDNRQDGGNGN